MNSYPRAIRRQGAAGWAITLVAGGAVALVGFASPARAACNLTPNGAVLVMSDNVFEARKDDVRKTGDMKRLADRMKEMAPNDYAPDVALIQEADRRAVVNIKNFMENEFPCSDFAIPVNSSKFAWYWLNKPWKQAGQDAAVIVNTRSMQVGKKGFINHDYARSDAAKGEVVSVKKTSWVQLFEATKPLDEHLEVLVASAHFPRGDHFRNDATNKRLKKRFSVDIAKKLEHVSPEGDAHDNVIHVLGGDLNNPRYVGDVTNETPLYETMTSSPWNYIDGPIALYEGGRPNPIDFLFSSHMPLTAQMDKNNTHDESSPNFYSNHNLRWSLLRGG